MRQIVCAGSCIVDRTLLNLLELRRSRRLESAQESQTLRIQALCAANPKSVAIAKYRYR